MEIQLEVQYLQEFDFGGKKITCGNGKAATTSMAKSDFKYLKEIFFESLINSPRPKTRIVELGST